MQERQRKLEQDVVAVAEEEPVPEPAEPAPPLKQPSGPLTLAQVAAANVPEVEAPAEAVVSLLLLSDASLMSYGKRGRLLICCTLCVEDTFHCQHVDAPSRKPQQ